MKLSHYLRLLGYAPGSFLLFLFMGGWLGYLMATGLRQTEYFELSFLVRGVFIMMIVTNALPALFKAPLPGIHIPFNADAYGELEFFFSRPISRHSLFHLRSSRYLLVCLLPCLIVWVCSYSKPVIKVKTYAFTHTQAEEEHFYLSYFPDAYLQPDPDDKTGGTVDVILPHGQVNLAFFAATWICFAALIYQLITFLFWQKKRAMIFIWIGFFLLPLLYVEWQLRSMAASVYLPKPSHFVPTFHLSGLAWVTTHTPLTLVLLGLLVAATEIYSCRRYINTEVIS